MTKYQKYFQSMVEEHKVLFDEFSAIHERYIEDSESNKEAFNETGKKVLDVIRQWEKLLCAKSEGGIYGKFSQNLADKFWAVIRTQYPRIDFIGVK